MRHSFSAAMVAMVAVVVGVAGAFGDAEPRKAALGERFDLAVGESARIEAERLQIGVEDVAADSRCPEGDRCVWEGDATVVVWLQKATAAKEQGELHTAQKEQGAVSYQGYEVRLLRLRPYPVSGRAIQQHEYRAAIEVTRGSSAADR
jgi:hypothetical protein